MDARALTGTRPWPRARALLGAVLLGMLLAVPFAGFARALPPSVTAIAGELQPRGSGEMRWFGFKVYEASLWVAPGTAQITERPFALAIRYARALPAERLVDASIDEMRRLGFGDDARLARWRTLLERALPSVAAGETLIGLHQPGRGVRFWHQGRPLADIADEELARAFFAIWLDERTREPDLRARLLGEAGATQ